MTASDTLVYNRKHMDSISTNTDRAFINDKFWLLIPFQLVWDQGTTISEPVKEAAPISNMQFHKITLTYPQEGGYTPGDAYDIYYDDNYMIREWVFREGNAEEPSLTNTFESYQEFNGIRIAKEHKKKDAEWNLTFTGVKVTTKE